MRFTTLYEWNELFTKAADMDKNLVFFRVVLKFCLTYS